MTMEMMMLEMTMVMMTMLEMMMMAILEMMIITGWVRQTLVESTRPLPRYVTLWCHHKYLCFGKQLAFKEPSAKTETLCKLSCVQIFTFIVQFHKLLKTSIKQQSWARKWMGWVLLAHHSMQQFYLGVEDKCPKLWRKMKVLQTIWRKKTWMKEWEQYFPPQGVGDSFPSTRGRLQVANLTKCSSYY